MGANDPRQDRERRLWELLPLIALLGGLILVGIPQYFRYDDAGWLHLARDLQGTPWRLFDPGFDRHAYSGLGDYYRPVVAAVYWVLYRVAGADPLPYQLASGVFFTVSMVYLALVARLLTGRLGAWMTILAYLSYAPLVAYGIYRMGLLHVGQALLLASAYHLARGAMRGSRRHLVFGVLCGIASALARQTAAVILPAVACVWVLTDARPWSTGERLLRTAAVAVIGGVLVAAILGVSHYSGGGGDLAAYATGRVLFYGRALFSMTSEPGGWIAAFAGLAGWSVALSPPAGGAAPAPRGARLVLALPVAAPLLTQVPAIALAVVLLGLAAAAWRHRDRAIALGLAWAVAGIVPYLAFHAGYARYLQESLYGFAVALAAVLGPWFRLVWPQVHHRARTVTRSPRGGEWIPVACVAAMPVCALLPSAALFLPFTHDVAMALRFSRESSRSVRLVVEETARALPRGTRIGEPSVDLSDLGDPAAREAASAGTRAVALPAMEPRDLQEMLAVLGRPDLTVAAWDPVGPAPARGAVVCLNGAQRDVAATLGWTAFARFGSGATGTALLVPRDSLARR